MIPDELIHRHTEFRRFARVRSGGIPRSEHWESLSPHFWAGLNKNGYQNLSKQNYFPTMASRPIIDQFPKGAYKTSPEENQVRMNNFSAATSKFETTLNKITIENSKLHIGSIEIKYDMHTLRGLHTLFLLRHHAGDFLMPTSRILEIGAGSGFVAAVFAAEFNSKIIIVDLPEMLTVSTALMMTIFPTQQTGTPALPSAYA